MPDGHRVAGVSELKRILLAEDDPRDVELTLAALDQNNLAKAVKEVGAFWAIVNEPPPGSVRR